jgi:hypothetical protein
MASALRTWYERISGGGALARTKKHVEASAHAIRAGGEAVVVGAALGAIDSHLKGGLDIAVGGTAATTPAAQQAGAAATTGKTPMHIPLDAVVAGVGILGGVAMAHEDFGGDLRNAGAAAAAVFSFRKTRDYTAAQMRMAGQTPGYQTNMGFQKSIGVGTTPPAAATTHGEFAGDPNADPILLAARNL